MSKHVSLVLGFFLAAGFTAVFRTFFSSTFYPVFNIALIFFILSFETLLCFIFSKKIEGSPLGKKIPTPDSLIIKISLYLPILIVLIMLSRPVFGLAFNDTLPWYAGYLYPAFLLFPLAAAAAFILKYISESGKNINLIFFPAGLFLFFVFDTLFLKTYFPISIVFLCSFSGFTVLFFLQDSKKSSRSFFFAAAALIFLTTVFTGGKVIHGFIRSIDRNSRQYSGGETTAYGETVLHGGGEETFQVSLNHMGLIENTYYEDITKNIHLAMLQFPWASRVLLIGQCPLTVKEILRYPDINSVYWASPVPQMCAYFDNNILDMERVRILCTTDGRSFIDNFGPENFFDIIIVTLPDPVNIFLNRYYTSEFFTKLQRASVRHSLVSVNLEAGDEMLSHSKQMLAASAYRSLKSRFPNTTHMYSRRSLILASQARGFSASPLPLVEYMEVVEDMPVNITLPLLIYKLSTSEKVSAQIDISGAPINSDLKPASLKYSFNELIYSIGIWRGFLVRMTDRLKPVWVYLFFIFAVLLSVLLLKRKNDRFKALAAVAATLFIYTLFIWNISVMIHSFSGKLYSYISAVALAASGGIFLSFKIIHASKTYDPYSMVSKFLVLSSLFFILVTVFFEFTITPPSSTLLFMIILAGSFLLMSVFYPASVSVLRAQGSGRSEAFRRIAVACFAGTSIAAAGGIFILPVMGLVEIFPLNTILLLGVVFLLNTQPSD